MKPKILNKYVNSCTVIILKPEINKATIMTQGYILDVTQSA